MLICESLTSFCTAIYPWDFYHEWVMGFASHQYKFHFDIMYGGLDMPYGSNNMKTAMEGSLDV